MLGKRLKRSVGEKGFEPPTHSSTGAFAMNNMAMVEHQFRGANASDLVLHAQLCLRFGDFEQALAICQFARSVGIDEMSILLTEATAQFASGGAAGALTTVDSVLRVAPEDISALYLKAVILMRLGDREMSRSLFLRVIQQFPNFPGALGMLSSLIMPGRPYSHVLNRLHQVLRPNTYLEIGVDSGATLALATTARQVVGVDPSDRLLDVPMPSTARVYRQTSDEFFALEKRETVFSGEPVDFVFIDGMHWFEYALRDFINAERWVSKESTIVLHDCLPASRLAATRDRKTQFWVGDVWKVLEALIEYRPDLDIRIIPTPPSGLVIVRRLNPSSAVLHEMFEEILTRYSARVYPYECGAFPAHYHIIENNDDALIQALANG